MPRTDIPEGHPCELGKRRLTYFAWDIGRIFWEVLCADYGKLLSNSVEWATNEERPATVTGPGVLDVVVWRRRLTGVDLWFGILR